MRSKRLEAWNKLIIQFSASSWLILRQIYWDARSAKCRNKVSCDTLHHAATHPYWRAFQTKLGAQQGDHKASCLEQHFRFYTVCVRSSLRIVTKLRAGGLGFWVCVPTRDRGLVHSTTFAPNQLPIERVSGTVSPGWCWVGGGCVGRFS